MDKLKTLQLLLWPNKVCNANLLEDAVKSLKAKVLSRHSSYADKNTPLLQNDKMKIPLAVSNSKTQNLMLAIHIFSNSNHISL
jgi:hypothetical protein